MTTPATPQVDCEQHHPSLAVNDVVAAVDFYTKKLGFRPAFTWGDPPTMAGVNLDRVQIFLEQGTPSPKGCSLYFVIGDADELYEFQRANGVEIVEPPEDRPYALRDYAVRDLSHSRSSGWMSRCAWRSVSPLCSTTWPSTSA
jgi:catechol 2,3-dioxygenase-like lactoylglutathione lyase family enzyme